MIFMCTNKHKSKKSTKRAETGNIELKPTIIFLVLVIDGFNFLIYFNT